MNVGQPARRRRPLIQTLYLWACHRLYNEFAWSYDAASWLVSAGHWSRWRELALDYLPPGRALEVGFGTGELLLALARRGWQACGVELSPAMQRITARKLHAHGLAAAVPRVRGVAQRLPFPDGYFDAVVATFPAEYIFDPASAREFARVLCRPGSGSRAGGRLVVGGMAISIDNTRLARLAPLFYGQPPARFLDRWQQVLAAAGLRPRIVAQPCGGAHVFTLVADKD